MKAKAQVTSDNVLDNISNEMDNVAAIRERLFSVVDIQVPRPPIKGIDKELIDEPDTKIIYTDKGKFLGHVGRIYESMQPASFLDSVIGTIEGCDNVNLDLSGLTYKELAGGKIINFRLPLGEIRLINKLGKEDISQTAIDFTTGFGGKSKTQISLFFHRLICSNGMRGWQSEMELSVKHTELMNKKVLLYCAQVMKMIGKVRENETIWNEMNRTEVSNETVKKFAEMIAGVKKEETKETMSTRKSNILDQVNEAISQEFAVTGATVWGLLNGATRYTNHFASGHEAEDYILVNSGAKVNELAQREAIALLN